MILAAPSDCEVSGLKGPALHYADEPWAENIPLRGRGHPERASWETMRPCLTRAPHAAPPLAASKSRSGAFRLRHNLLHFFCNEQRTQVYQTSNSSLDSHLVGLKQPRGFVSEGLPPEVALHSGFRAAQAPEGPDLYHREQYIRVGDLSTDSIRRQRNIHVRRMQTIDR